MKPDSLDVNHLQEIDMKKVEALKKAVSEGSYTVPAEDLAPKLMESMFQNIVLDEDSRVASVPSDRSPAERGPKRRSR